MRLRNILKVALIFAAGYAYRGCHETPSTLASRLYDSTKQNPTQYAKLIDRTEQQMHQLQGQAHWQHSIKENCLDPKNVLLELGEQNGKDYAYLRLSGPMQGAYLLKADQQKQKPVLEQIVEVRPE